MDGGRADTAMDFADALSGPADNDRFRTVTHKKQNKMLSYRRETEWRTELGDNILRTLYHCDIIGLKIYRIRRKMQNESYYGVQGHSMSSRSVPIESPYGFPISV